MTGRLEGKVALVTGAGSGLGAAIARRFADEGARVIVSDVNLAAASEVARHLGGGAVALRIDVADPADWAAALPVIEDAFGALHILVNNAGICLTGSVEDISIEDWKRKVLHQYMCPRIQ